MADSKSRFDRRKMPDKNPLTHADVNDLFVFAPTVATVAILIVMTYGLGVVTVKLLDFILYVPTSIQSILSLVVSLLYVGVSLFIVKQDNGVETPTDWL